METDLIQEYTSGNASSKITSQIIDNANIFFPDVSKASFHSYIICRQQGL